MTTSHEHDTTMALEAVPKGTTVIVTATSGGRSCTQRLADMGVRPGTVVRVMKGGGPVMIDVGGSRLMIGRGLSSKITVRVDR